MELKSIDLNLLVVLDHLLRERRVSRAAQALGLSQPAVSNALARLRRLLGDTLLVPTSRGMVPTPRAEALAQPIAEALALLDCALNDKPVFDPATSTRAFTLGMTDIGEIYFLPTLLKTLERRAPQVTVSTVRNAAVNLRDEMADGHVDLALGLLPTLKAGFLQRRLFRQRYVCLCRKGHALTRGKPSLDDFEAMDHVVVESAGTGHGRIDRLLERGKVARRVRLRVPHFVAMGHILASSDLVATVPERFAQCVVEPFGLVALPHPVRLPDAAISQFWHARVHHDPANQWLRRLLVELFGD